MGNTLTLTSSDGFQLGAYRADPTGAPKGAVVVIQEIFGVNSHIRSVVDRYASNGYVAIAPALFDRVRPGVELGYTEDDIAVGIDMARGKTDPAKALDDIRAAAAAVADTGKVGVVGYCWGGMLTALAAIDASDVFSAAAAYYGGGTPALADRTPVAPMVMHYGEHDHAIPLADVEKLQAAWPVVTFHIYDAQHGFNCDQRGSYDAASSKLAEERTLAFFGEHLGG
jgi:carboxymethylenebutenolidase